MLNCINISKMFFVLCVAGCTTAGPYVTNISSDGAGGFNVEKCSVKYNILLHAVSTSDCYSSSLKLTSPPSQK